VLFIQLSIKEEKERNMLKHCIRFIVQSSYFVTRCSTSTDLEE
jgi:hypothetical protein